MKFIEKLLNISRKNNSLVCVGLDTDISKIPEKFLKEDDPVLSFNKCIIDQTCDIVSAYKVNSAFYEIHGELNYLLSKSNNYIPEFLNTSSINGVIVDDFQVNDDNGTGTYFQMEPGIALNGMI